MHTVHKILINFPPIYTQSTNAIQFSNPNEIITILESFAKIGYPACSDNIAVSSAGSISNSKLGVSSGNKEDLVQKDNSSTSSSPTTIDVLFQVASRIVSLNIFSSNFNLKRISHIAKGFSILGYVHEELMDAIAIFVEDGIGESNFWYNIL